MLAPKMPMNVTDRILTIVATVTLTSAAWIMVGGSLIENASDLPDEQSVRPAVAAPSPTPASSATSVSDPSAAAENDLTVPGEIAAPLDRGGASQPDERAANELMIPVKNVRPADLTNTFSDSRSGEERLHEALDIMAPKGTSVVAAGPGTIERLFASKAGGNTIYIRTPDGETIHYYAHLDAYAKGLQEGQRVRRGQRLGTVGTSGKAKRDTPHLHFAILRTTADAEWWEPANPVNPYRLFVK